MTLSNSIDGLNKTLGNPDLYLLDFILKGNLNDKKRLLDAGCGEGRNIYYLSQQKGVEIFGVDNNALALKLCRMYLKSIDAEHFIQANLDKLPFENNYFDAIICSAVLHFARDESQFKTMWNELTRVSAPGTWLFLRMASTWGLEQEQEDGFDFHLNDYWLEQMCQAGWEMASPPKSVWVNGERSMSVIEMIRTNKQYTSAR